jgi:DNA-binding transcriptional regulator LsrR (DeoR family)
MAQKGLKDVFALARAAKLHIVGIGEVGPKAHMLATGTITAEEFRQLERAGAVGEVLGQFLDARGRPVEADINQRAVAVQLAEIKGTRIVAIAGGRTKTRAIAAVLESRVVTGLITDETTAKAIVQHAAGAGPTVITAQGKQPRRKPQDVR